MTSTPRPTPTFDEQSQVMGQLWLEWAKHFSFLFTTIFFSHAKPHTLALQIGDHTYSLTRKEGHTSHEKHAGADDTADIASPPTPKVKTKYPTPDQTQTTTSVSVLCTIFCKCVFFFQPYILALQVDHTYSQTTPRRKKDAIASASHPPPPKVRTSI